METQIEELKIEKGIPVATFKKYSEYTELINKMQTGDSVYFNGKEYTRKEYDARSFSMRIRAMGFKSSCRKEGEGYRVWKL